MSLWFLIFAAWHSTRNSYSSYLRTVVRQKTSTVCSAVRTSKKFSQYKDEFGQYIAQQDVVQNLRKRRSAACMIHGWDGSATRTLGQPRRRARRVHTVTVLSLDGLPSYNLDGTAIVLPQALLEPPEPKITNRRRKHRQHEGKSARKLKVELAKAEAAAIKMQATVRGHNARKASCTREAAAIKMQATFRGRNERNASCMATVRHTTLPAADLGRAELWGHSFDRHNLKARHSSGYSTSRPPIVIQVLMSESRSRSSWPGQSPRSSLSSQLSGRSTRSSRTRRSSRSNLVPSVSVSGDEWHDRWLLQEQALPAAKPASGSVEELLTEWNRWRTLPD